ncbi:MAG: sugar phosphate isomerase/epimerase [Bryobacteraceae bacterium]
MKKISRRHVLAASAYAAVAPVRAAARPPIGLELFSVRGELKKDLFATVRAVAKMGYAGVEFFSPYFDWTPEYAKDVRKLLDDSGIRCFSTHNGARSLARENLTKAIDLNGILGSKFIIMASAGHVEGLDGWKAVAGTLSQAAEKLGSAGMRTGFHNHKAEFVAIGGVRPMEVLARETPKSVVLQLDVGTCVEAGVDPVAWINRNPGRIASVHCKDWAPGEGYRVLTGEGKSPWKEIITAAEKVGGVEYYLVEQEGSRFSEFETAERCLAEFRRLRG